VREGGWYAVLDASAVAPPGGDEEMALDLLSRDGVFVHPGYFYDFARDGHLVVSLLTPPDVLADGAAEAAVDADGPTEASAVADADGPADASAEADACADADASGEPEAPGDAEPLAAGDGDGVGDGAGGRAT